MGIFNNSAQYDGTMKNTVKKPLSIIADPGLLIMVFIYVFIVSTALGGIIIDTCITGNKHDVIAASSICGISEAGVAFGIYLAIPQWFIKITFLPDGIRIKAARKKPTVRPYKYYQYVYKASYWHGSPIGIGIIKDYIVISHRRLNDAELCNINQVAGSTDIIKIKYSPKTYQTLMDTLPREMAYKLKVCRFE